MKSTWALLVLAQKNLSRHFLSSDPGAEIDTPGCDAHNRAMPATSKLDPPPAPVAAPKFRWRWFLPRPAEWVVVVFWGYVFLRLILHGDLERSIRLTVFRPEIFGALIWVLMALMLRDFLRRPWPAGRERFRRFHTLGLLPAGLPLMLAAIVMVVGLPWALASAPPDMPVPVFLLLYSITALATIGFLGAPTLMIWAAVGQNGKQPAIDPAGRFVRSWSYRAIDAARDWLPPALLVFGYSVMQQVLDIPLWRDLDPEIAAADRFLFFGHDPVRALQAIIWPPPTVGRAFCTAKSALLSRRGRGRGRAVGGPAALRKLALASTLCMGIGFITYSLVPVVGPMLHQSFDVPIHIQYVWDLKEALMDRARIQRDCFPSMHTANTLLFAYFVFCYSRRWFWLLLPFVVSIPFACVYLRYHYVLDVLAGAVLAAAVVVCVRRMSARGE
jgi:membrane-associated phospholipid phosphatase